MEGYPALAEVMSLNDGLDIFRRFSTLNALNLLYMQAELVDLEYDLKDIAAEDCSADAATPKNEGRDSYHVSARALRESGRRGDDLQWAKVLEARNLLKEYSRSRGSFLSRESRYILTRIRTKKSIEKRRLMSSTPVPFFDLRRFFIFFVLHT